MVPSGSLQTVIMMTPSPTLSEKFTGTGNLVLRYEILVSRYALLPEAWFRDLITWWFRDIKAWFRIIESLVPKHESLKQMDFTAIILGD